MTSHEVWTTLVTMLSTIVGMFVAQALYWRWKGRERASMDVPQDLALLKQNYDTLLGRLMTMENDRRIDCEKIERLRISHAALRAFLTKKLNGESHDNAT
jgi:hypothetical protein